MAISVRQLQQTRRQRRSFIELPYRLYRGNPQWVAPFRSDMQSLLDPDVHPFHQHSETALFVAEKDRRIVGRITAHVDHLYEERWDRETGFFGFFESEDDPSITSALMEVAGQWLRERGKRVMMGPFNWSMNQECGTLVDGFDKPPVVMMTYNPPSYPTLLEQAGLSKAKDLYAYWMDDPEQVPPRLQRGYDLVSKRRNITYRMLDMSRFAEDVELGRKLYNEAWADNWGEVPATEAEFRYLAKELKQIIRPELVFFAYVDGKLAGFSLSVPDANVALHKAHGRLFPIGIFRILATMRSIPHMRVITLGVLKEYRLSGVDVVLYYATFTHGRAIGINTGEMSWILEDNYPMRNAIERFGGQHYKTYRIYQKAL